MRSSLRLVTLGALFLLVAAAPAAAQYMRITTDNPADPTRLRAVGQTTVLTITVDTFHDRDGSVQSCNSHTAAACGSVATGQPLNIFSYTLTLITTGGTVTWGDFTAADSDYSPLGPDLVSSTQIEINRFKSGTFTPPGLVTLGSIPVTPVSGSPRIDIAHGTQTIDPYGFGTGFGTSCDGFAYTNTYVLGDPAFVCGSGDWLDVDGVAGPDGGTPPGDGNRCPVSLPGGIYAGLVGVPVAFDGTASLDPDGDPLTYAWDFDIRNGIGVDATGPTPSHTFPVQFTYTITLTVTDNATPPCSSSATTFANITDLCPATLLSGYEPIKLGSGRDWFALVQPSSNCYVNSDVVPSSLSLSFGVSGP